MVITLSGKVLFHGNLFWVFIRGRGNHIHYQFAKYIYIILWVKKAYLTSNFPYSSYVSEIQIQFKSSILDLLALLTQMRHLILDCSSTTDIEGRVVLTWKRAVANKVCM